MSDTQLVRTVTAKGQVTIPAEVRRRLGLAPGDRVIFAIEDDQVIVRAAPETLRSAYGAVAPLARPEDWQRARDIAIAEKAERTAREMG